MRELFNQSGCAGGIWRRHHVERYFAKIAEDIFSLHWNNLVRSRSVNTLLEDVVLKYPNITLATEGCAF